MIKTMKEFKGLFEAHVSRASQIIITPHKCPDYDAIAAALAFSTIVKALGKPSAILLEDMNNSLQKGVRNIVEATKNKYDFITMDGYEQRKTKKDILLATDVNQTSRITFVGDLSYFQSIFVVDHHQENKNALPTEFKYIPSKVSSTSEIATQFLNSYKVRITKKLAKYLLMGMALDTARFTSNVYSNTMTVCGKLLAKGADLATIYDEFPEDFESDRRMQRIVDTAVFMPHDTIKNKKEQMPYQTAIAVSKDTIYTTDEIARAADYLKQFADATFAIGTIGENKIAMSARSKGFLNVASIMEQMNGGGSAHSAATQFSLQEGETIEEVQAQLVEKIQSPLYVQLEPQKKLAKTLKV